MTELRDRELERLFARHDDPSLEARVSYRAAVGDASAQTGRRRRHSVRGAVAGAALLGLLLVALLIVVARRPEPPRPAPATVPPPELPVVFTRDGAVWWAPADRLEEARWIGSGRRPALSGDGRFVLAYRPVGAQAADLVLYEPGRGDATVLARLADAREAVRPVWAQDAPIAAVPADDGVVTVAAQSGTVTRIPLLAARPVTALALSPDGRTLLVQGGEPSGWWVLDVAAKTVRQVALGQDVRTPVWTTTGVYAARDNGEIVRLTRIAGPPPEPWRVEALGTVGTVATGPLEVAGVAADGRRIAFTTLCFHACSRVGILDVVARAATDRGTGEALGMSADGDRVLVAKGCDSGLLVAFDRLRVVGAPSAEVPVDACDAVWATATTSGAPVPPLAAPVHDVLLVRRVVSGFSRVDLRTGATELLQYEHNFGDANPAIVHTGNRFVWHGDWSVDDRLTTPPVRLPADSKVRSDALLPATPGTFWRIELGPGNRTVTGAERVAADTGQPVALFAGSGTQRLPGIARGKGLYGAAGRALLLRDIDTDEATRIDGLGPPATVPPPAGQLVDGMLVACAEICRTVTVQDLAARGAEQSVALPAPLRPKAWLLSADRTRLATLIDGGSDTNRIVVVNLAARTARILPTAYTSRAEAPPVLTWSAEGTRLLVVDADGRLWDIAADGGRAPRLVTTLPAPAIAQDAVAELAAS